MVTPSRGAVWIAVAFALPMLACFCCMGAFFGPLVPSVVGHLPLIVAGKGADATITAITPCTRGVVLAASEQGGGWHYQSGATVDGVQISVSFIDDAENSQRGQTFLCTDAPSGASVGSSVGIIYSGNSGDVILVRDAGAYQQFAFFLGASVGMLLFVLLLLFVAMRRAQMMRLADAPFPVAAPLVQTNALPVESSWGLPPAGALDENGARIRALHEAAVGPTPAATTALGLKEALLLLHLRLTEPAPRDDPDQGANAVPLRDHLVLAAMLVDLLRQGRITVEYSALGRPYVVVVDGSPVVDPDTEALLAALRAAPGRVWLRQFYTTYGRLHLVARLIDQMRRGGYLGLHVPLTGRYAATNASSGEGRNPLRAVARWAARVGFERGTVVATDDFRLVLPWHFLFTTHTAGEESIFAQVQAAIANGNAADDFTLALVGLISAHYLSWTWFPRSRNAAKSIYRFYPPEERRAIMRVIKDITRRSPPAWQAIFTLARTTDDTIESPPGD